MTQTTKYDGTPITNAIEIGPDGQPGYSVTSQLGTPGYSNVIVDDPDSSLTFETWRDWTVDESDCTDFPRVFTGMIYARRIIRGPYRDGPGRQWSLDIVDLNGLLALRVISGADGKRPAEEDDVRVAWLIASDYLSDEVFDNGQIATDPRTGALDESDYTGQYPMDVLVSVAGPVARNAYVYWDKDAAEPSLFYNDAQIALEAATIGFSNVLSDVDNDTVFYPFIDAETVMDGEDRYGGIFLGTRAGNIYRQDAGTITAMGGRIRDVAVQTDRIGHADTADDHADNLLAYHADDLQTVRFTADLPSTHVNLARPGMSMTVRFSHVPGYEDGVTVLIWSMLIQQLQAGRYRIQYQVAPNPLAPIGEGGGSPGDFPHEPPSDHWWEGSGTVGNQSGFVSLSPDSPTFVPGVYNYHLHVKNNNTYAAKFRIENAGVTQGWMLSGGSIGIGLYGEFTWDGSFEIPDDGDPVDDNPPGGTGPFGGFLATGSGHDFITAGGFTDGYLMQGGCAGPHSPSPEEFADFDFYIDLVGTTVAQPAPAAGQPVENELSLTQPDGSTLIFFTKYPYADGSLRVFVDNLNQTAAVTESDPTTGEFTLAFAPRADEVVRTYYLGR